MWKSHWNNSEKSTWIEQYGEFQSGFKKIFSCEIAVNFVINSRKNRQKKNKVLAIFLDFKRVFETKSKDIVTKRPNIV